MTPIYLLLPTRGRPAKLARSIESCKRLATHPDRVYALLYVDEDDATDYSGQRYIHRAPRCGYRGLHHMYNVLTDWARELDGDGPPGWQIMWNDDEEMLTQGWDEKLLRYGESPKVVFMRRDCTGAVDTAYPAWPRSLVDLTRVLGVDSACDTWLALLTGAADRLIGRSATHVHALDVFVRHDRDEADRSEPPAPAPIPDYTAQGDMARLAFRLAAHYDAPCYSPPFGVDARGVPIVR
jgi:hypothetical protein